MSRKGGYKIIDFKGTVFPTEAGEDAYAPAGTYDAIEDNYGKALLFSGVKFDADADPVPDFWVYNYTLSSVFEFEIPMGFDEDDPTYATPALHYRLSSVDTISVYTAPSVKNERKENK